MDFLGKDRVVFPKSTAIGALSHYVSDSSIKNFQPMNVNFGIMESFPLKIRDKRKRNYETAMRALKILKEYVSNDCCFIFV